MYPTVGFCSLLRTQSSEVLPFKPGVGQNIALHVLPTARYLFFPKVYPHPHPQSIHLHFFLSKTSPEFPVLAVVNTSSCVDPQNKKRLPCSSLRMIDAGFRVKCPRKLKSPQNVLLCFWVGSLRI